MWPAVIADSIGRRPIADAMKVLDFLPPLVTAFRASAGQLFDVYSFQHGQKVPCLLGGVPMQPPMAQSVFRDMTIERARSFYPVKLRRRAHPSRLRGRRPTESIFILGLSAKDKIGSVVSR